MLQLVLRHQHGGLDRAIEIDGHLGLAWVRELFHRADDARNALNAVQ